MSVFNARYDKTFAYQMFLLYLEDNTLFDQALRSVAPLIGSVVCFTVPSDPLNVEFICSDVFGQIYDVFRRKSHLFNIESETTWNNYLYIVIRNTLINTIKQDSKAEIPSGIFELEQISNYSANPSATLNEFIDRQQTDELVLNLIPHEIRFVDGEYKACIFLAEIMLGKRKNKYTDICPRFVEFKRVNFFIRYVQLLIEDLRDYVTTSDGAVQEGSKPKR
jgi:hypothetical protein